MSKHTLSEILYWSFITVVLSCILAAVLTGKAYAIQFPSYAYITLEDLSNNADKYNGQEIQIRGEIQNMDEFTGAYGGQYIGLSLDHGIMVMIYASEIHKALVVGDVILVSGTFHKYGKYGGQGHDYYIATHHMELMQ